METNRRSNSFTGSTAQTPPQIKPPSRGRAYRIPNTADVAADTAKNGGAGGGESFLWATREIAALDFLMNVPLCSEREIVRAGLSGERWSKHNNEILQSNGKQHPSDVELGIVYESAETNYGIPSTPNQIPHRWSNFSISRNLSVEDDSTLSTIYSMSEKASSSGAPPDFAAAPTPSGRWWDKLILKDKRFFSAANQQQARLKQLEMEERDLECPDDYEEKVNISKRVVSTPTNSYGATGVPGRRLGGRESIRLEMPKEFRTRPLPIRAVARHAAVREWEMSVAWHGVQSPYGDSTKRAILDGRVFFSGKLSYPMSVFSCIKYEPQKEEAARRRKKLEELGGGGTQFVLPERDWRGISYCALLPHHSEKKNKEFHRMLGIKTSLAKNTPVKKTTIAADSSKEGTSDNESDEDSLSSASSDDSDVYTPGFLDDRDMRQGRHRNVMIGDKVTGPIISSTIQFVKPSLLKAELNKQFRERFDQWEPPKSARKYIGARIIDGIYTLIDPTDTVQEDEEQNGKRHPAGSINDHDTIRMPPSLTLSKIRSLKQQALVACVRSQIELSTLALACVYFERLCLDCRVDKSNRRLSFAASLLLAAKVNESNTIMAFDPGAETKSWAKPSKKSGKIFESLVVFFTHDWSISLKQLYAAEWIVFTALGFSLKSTPSQVAFHFKRLLKVLEWDARSYLGNEMYSQWQDSMMEETRRRERRNARKELRIQANKRRLLKLQRKLHNEGSHHHRRTSTSSDSLGNRRHSTGADTNSIAPETPKHDTSATLLPKAESPAAVKSIFSRLARPKPPHQQVLGEDLDQLQKQEKKITWSRHAFSTPNLNALEKEVVSGMEDADKNPEDKVSPSSKDDTEMDYST